MEKIKATNVETVKVIEYRIEYKCPKCEFEDQTQLHDYYKHYSTFCKECLTEFIVEFK